MTETEIQNELTQRKVNNENVTAETEIEEAKDNKENEKNIEEGRTTWQSVKYYFNRFRYYHFVVADAIDKYLSAACLWILNLYFKLFWGMGPEPPSVLTEEN